MHAHEQKKKHDSSNFKIQFFLLFQKMAEEVLQFNVASVVEDVLQQHGKRLANTDNSASRRAEEACMIHHLS